MKKLFILLLLSSGTLFAQVTNPPVSISGNAATASAADHSPGACAANTFAQSQSTAWSFTCAALTLAGAQFANQGTATTVAHGNAAGNPSWGSVVDGDIAFTTPSLGAPTITNGWIVSTSPAVTHIDQSNSGVFDFYRTDSITDSVAFRLWNGRIDASNYQRLFLGTDGTGFQIGTYNAGSPAAQSLRLATSGVVALTIDTSQNVALPIQAVTAGTMTVTNSALVRSVWHRFDWTNAMVTALGATTAGDVSICTLPAKTVVTNAYVVIKTAAATVTTLSVAVGRTSAAYIDYVVASDAKAAANTVYGDASGERGTNLTSYDLSSYTGTTVVNAHFISTGGNLSTTTTSTGTVYLKTETLP